MGTTIADRRCRCGYCGRSIAVGDEIGFGTIKNKNRTPPEREVPICLPCWMRAQADKYGAFDG